MKSLLVLILTLIACAAYAQSNLPSCQGDHQAQQNNCFPAEEIINNFKTEYIDKNKTEIYIIKEIKNIDIKSKEKRLEEYENFDDAWEPWKRVKNIYFNWNE